MSATTFDTYTMNMLLPLDEHGEPVKRRKTTHPYNYDGFVLWRGGVNSEANDTIYSDRLLTQDMEKFNVLSQKHFGDSGQNFSIRSPEQIQEFLREWTGNDKLTLIFIMEYCNRATGYPVWRFECGNE